MALFSFIWRLFSGDAATATCTPKLELPPIRRPTRPAAPTNETDESTPPNDPAPAPQPGEPAAGVSADDAPTWWMPRPGAIANEAAAPPAPLIDEALFNSLSAALDDPEIELPRMPQVADRVLLQLRDPEADNRKLAELVEQDPALTVEIFKRANSAAFRGYTEINQLEIAFARLGQRELRALVLNMTLKSVTIRLGGAQRSIGEELWRRAVASGVIVAELSPFVGLAEADGFLIGLLHDIGMFAVLKVVHDYSHKAHCRTPRAVFVRLCEQWHEHIGARLAVAWRLPDPLPALIGAHHRGPAAADPLEKQRCLIQTADAACALLEYAPYVPHDFFHLNCVRRLGLQDIPAARERLERLPDQIRERIESQ